MNDSFLADILRAALESREDWERQMLEWLRRREEARLTVGGLCADLTVPESTSLIDRTIDGLFDPMGLIGPV